MAEDPNRISGRAVSRRKFMQSFSAAMLPASLRGAPIAIAPAPESFEAGSASHQQEFRLAPHYRLMPPLEDLTVKVDASRDAFISEKFAEEIEDILRQWTRAFREPRPNLEVIEKDLSPSLVAFAARPSEDRIVRSRPEPAIRHRVFARPSQFSRERFIREFILSLAEFSNFSTAEFQVIGIRAPSASPPVIQTRVRYDLVGPTKAHFRAQRVGHWEIEWGRNGRGKLLIRRWEALGETLTLASRPIFTDITSRVLGGNSSYTAQLLRGTDFWRTTLEAASGIDVYGNNGLAVGDFDNDGFDDLYVCQPGGLPNRLYRNRGDGTFEDVTDTSGVGVLDSTPCALFADFDNDGYQDLVVVRSSGPFLFLNQRNGKFLFKPDAFRFAAPPRGTFTGAAIADYDRDGWLDVYFCLYLYYQGLDQYQFPVPYADARNGPPNFLFRNNRDGSFVDVTASAGMNQNNDRFSFACGWCDYDQDGWPDLYVANDFGRNNLYHNNGDATFTDVATDTGVEDIGAGMSVCWFDYDGDGRQDLYVSNMWSAAGKRLTRQEDFKKGAAEEVRTQYRKHADGNSLFHNEGNGRWTETSSQAGVEMGRWAWSSDAWDFDHDGYPDLYVANGMISGPNRRDLAGFFWRQVVARSPLEADASPAYEQGWNAVNELIRSDWTWSGHERNTFYVNNRDGTFSDASGAVGLDFSDDSRAFALADIDHDGRLEVFLKNRTGPQIRVLRNEAPDLGASIAFRLRGTKSNLDAVGAEVVVEAGGRRWSKFLQAGSGFLSQHTKELFFGLGEAEGAARAIVRWPSGLVQQLENLPPNHRFELVEGVDQISSKPFALARPSPRVSATPKGHLSNTAVFESWLLDPPTAPDFALPDLAGRVHNLRQIRGRVLLLNFWAMSVPACEKDLTLFQQKYREWEREGLALVSINANPAGEAAAVRDYARAKGYSFSILSPDEDTLGVYNVLFRYMFDRRRDMSLPTSFLVDDQGLVIKVYQGPINPGHVRDDLRSIPKTPPERAARALPFPGRFYGGEFLRNQFSYGVAFLQRGYLDQAALFFELALRSNPEYAEAHYNLGTIFLGKKMPGEARRHFDQALKVRPDYPDALNNLGLIAAEEGKLDEAIKHFQEAIRRRPNYGIALENLGNLYRQHGRWAEAQKLLERALETAPDDPEANYSLGMLFAQKEETEQARKYLMKAIQLRPDYSEAINNLGVLYLRARRPEEAMAAFRDCIRVAPDFDQPYLNLAKVYVGVNDRKKARQILEELLARQPKHPLARQAVEALDR